jgi:hypothetical protein
MKGYMKLNVSKYAIAKRCIMSRVRLENVILTPPATLVAWVCMLIKGLSCKPSSRGRLGDPLCIRTRNADPSCLRAFKSHVFDGRDCSKSCCTQAMLASCELHARMADFFRCRYGLAVEICEAKKLDLSLDHRLQSVQ